MGVSLRGRHSLKRGCAVFLFLCGALFLSLLPGPAFAEAPSLPLMQLHQVDVGCANCHLLIAGDTVILIDGGTNSYKSSGAPAGQRETGDSPQKMLDYVAASGIDHIDVHFVTHYHNDHCQQMQVFSELYGTDSTVVYGPSDELPDFLLPLPNGSYRRLSAGDKLTAGPFRVLCVGPETVRRDGHINQDSLNLLITYGSFRMLFTGDYIGENVHHDFAEEIRDVDVFVFPHHGLEPFMASSGTLKHVNAKVILIPGDTEGRVRLRCRSLSLDPEIYGNVHGNIVLTSTGSGYTVYEQVAPGDFAGKAAP